MYNNADIRYMLSYYLPRTLLEKIARLYENNNIIYYILGKYNNKFYINKYELSISQNRIIILSIYKNYTNIRHIYSIYNEFIWCHCIESYKLRLSCGNINHNNIIDFYTINGQYYYIYIYSNYLSLSIFGKNYKYNNSTIYNLIRDHFNKINDKSREFILSYKKLI